MKKSIYIALLLIVSTATIVIAQNNSVKSSQAAKKKYVYCCLSSVYRPLKRSTTFSISGNAITSDAVRHFEKEADAMDYMGSEGWELVNTVMYAGESTYEYYFYFKKDLN